MHFLFENLRFTILQKKINSNSKFEIWGICRYRSRVHLSCFICTAAGFQPSNFSFYNIHFLSFARQHTFFTYCYHYELQKKYGVWIMNSNSWFAAAFSVLLSNCFFIAFIDILDNFDLIFLKPFWQTALLFFVLYIF